MYASDVTAHDTPRLIAPEERARLQPPEAEPMPLELKSNSTPERSYAELIGPIKEMVPCSRLWHY